MFHSCSVSLQYHSLPRHSSPTRRSSALRCRSRQPVGPSGSTRQSTPAAPCFSSSSLTREKGRDPKKPREADSGLRSEEHTSELQSRGHLVCRLLLGKKKRRTSQRSTV